MDFLHLIKNRQSVRKYQNRNVEKEKIDKLIEAVRLAPSASNSQPWKIIIVDNPALKDQVARAANSKTIQFNKFAIEAPLIAVLVIEKPTFISQIGGRIMKREYVLIDIGIAAEHFCLQAAELGLGTCMLGWFNERAVKSLLKIPENKRIGLLITVGYPADNYPIRDKRRKTIEEISSFNQYTG
jgi:nitroreductase